ncbi:MAG: cobalamin-dependent protein [Pseudomonadota bacterium]
MDSTAHTPIASSQVTGKTLAQVMTKVPPGSDGASGSHEATSGGAADEQSQGVYKRQENLRTVLSDVLTGRIIPRIVEANTASPRRTANVDRAAFDAFITCVLEGTYDACCALVKAHLESGTSLRNLCMGLFTVAAETLGELWEDDQISFPEVTIALGRLHKLVHQFSTASGTLKSPVLRHHILLASASGEQHAFGLLLVSKIFEMEGWIVTGGPDTYTGVDVRALVNEGWFDIVGLSASSPDLARALKPEIKRIRAASLNPDVCIMVGGTGFAEDADLAQAIGADAHAVNADDAILKAQELLRARDARMLPS